jgi:hypothetical protein
MTARAYITDHAVVRWLERHDGIDLAGIRAALRAEGQFASDGAVLARLKRDRGISADSVRSRMATPTLDIAVRSGASGVRTQGVRMVIVGGHVVTVRLVEWDLNNMNHHVADPIGMPRADRRAAVATRDFMQDSN